MRALSASFAVSPQLRTEDLPELAQAGVRTIISNRPDGEEPGQPTSAEMERAARAVGLDFVAIPFSGRPGGAEINAMAAALEAADGLVLAFCRSGTRSAAAWANVQARKGRPTDELIEAAASAGYDLRAWLL